MIHNPTIKTTPPGITNSAAYFSIMNHSEKDMSLVGVASDRAKIVEIHEHVMANGAMKMQKVESLKIPAKTTVNFEPGSYHVMFIGVNQEIKQGDKINITLTFDNGTEKTITSIAEEQPTGSHKKHHKHH